MSEERFEFSRVSLLGPKTSAAACQGLVPMEGFEPSSLAARGPKPRVFTNFTTSALNYSSSISKTFFFVFSNFGRIIVSNPFLMVALALSALIS